MTNFKIYDPSELVGEINSVEDFLSSYDGDFPTEGVFLYVQSIEIGDYGYRLNTEECQAFVSFKFRQLAAPIKRYLSDGKAGKPLQAMAIFVSGKKKKGYAEWKIAKDSDLQVTMSVPDDDNVETMVYTLYIKGSDRCPKTT